METVVLILSPNRSPPEPQPPTMEKPETMFKTITTIERERATAERLAFLAVSGQQPETMDRAEPVAVIVDELRYRLSTVCVNRNPFERLPV